MLTCSFVSVQWLRPRTRTLVLARVCGALAIFLTPVGAEESRPSETHAICEIHPATPVSGSLFICGGGVLPARVLDRFFEIAGGEKSRIVIVTTASGMAGTPEIESWHSSWKQRPHTSLDFFHTRRRTEADSPAFCQKLKDATAVWFVGGNQNWLAEAYLGTLAEKLFHEALHRGGVIGGTSAGAAIMSRTMIAGGRHEPVMATGMGFLPGAIVDQHFLKRKRHDRLKQALELRPGHVGIGIDESTALIVSGRSLEVIGDSEVTVCLAPSDQRGSLETRIAEGQQEDLIKLSRAAIARAQPRSPAKKQIPEVKKGTLVIVGGGSTPREAVDQFLSAAGGKDAPIIVVSNALGDDPPEEQNVCGWLKDAGASNVRQLHARDQSELSSPAMQVWLRQARGVWFTGGRQWRLVDAYLDTPIQSLFHEVLRRGGVIGGTSAGAAIQGEYLVRSNPPGNKDTVTEGYERGFGFLPGVAIDEKVAEQDCFEELTELKKTHPQLVGIGIDDATAVIVRGTTMEVVGRNKVSVFNRLEEGRNSGSEFELVSAGQKYDFRQRQLMDHPQTKSAEKRESDSTETK